LQKQGIELIFFDRVLPNFEASKVVVDDYNGAYTATEFLIKKGYKRIAHIGGSKEFIISKKRFKGYTDALKKHKIPVDETLIYFGGFQEKNGVDGMQYLLGAVNKPDAVVAVNDPVALGAYEVIKSRGLKIPKDIAVVGFSNNPISAIVDPPLTTIEQPAYEMGRVEEKR
ncbi:MAG TPA: LacI family transcriptional regulator, partial [Candidatus Korarchaeota archaeon]|nr:LacI family transcriptional regulator [Candidatus Korarchaeota archaeon]